jgi:hypothetical protein
MDGRKYDQSVGKVRKAFFPKNEGLRNCVGLLYLLNFPNILPT